MSRRTRGFAQASRKIDQGIETFIQPGRKLLCRAEEALMKLTSHGYRPTDLVDQNEALEVSETPPAEFDDPIKKENSSRSQTTEVQILPWRLEEAKDASPYPPLCFTPGETLVLTPEEHLRRKPGATHCPNVSNFGVNSFYYRRICRMSSPTKVILHRKGRKPTSLSSSKATQKLEYSFRIDSSSTSNCVVGRDRPSKIYAIFGHSRSCSGCAASASSKTQKEALLGSLFGRNGASGGLGGPISKHHGHLDGSELLVKVGHPFGVKTHECVAIRNHFKHPVDRPNMHVVHFFKKWAPSFCFHTCVWRFRKNMRNGARFRLFSK